MCGICGLIFSEIRQSSSDLYAMMQELEHRGPDDSGYAAFREQNIFFENSQIIQAPDANVLFGHHRLSIQDLSKLGVQPMISQCEKLSITFNGEIYNYIELRDELEILGWKFSSGTDTEVILAGYKFWGEDVLSRLVGMFAFAIWDADTQSVFLARDPAGIKPLYYTFWEGGLAFASEIKALMKLPGIERFASKEQTYYFLRFGITDQDENTMFAAVKQILPGTKIRVPIKNPTGIETATYYKFHQPDYKMWKSKEHVISKLREQFLKSISLHMRSDVPVGVALSGGIDSSSIAFAVRHLMPDIELHSFSFVSEEKNTSEEKWIDIATSGAKCRVHKVTPTPEELMEEFNEIVYAEDLPSADFGIYAQHRVAKMASDAGIKVLLSGEGGDELFAGYVGYTATKLAYHLKNGEIISAFKFFKAARKLPGRASIIKEIAQYLIPYSLQGPLRKLIGKELTPAWLNKKWFQDPKVFTKPIVSGRRKTLLRDVLDQAIQSTTLPHLLRYQDRASMCYSVESRVPFLTGNFIELSRNIPEKFLISDTGVGKDIFISAMKGIVPDELLDRKDKAGFDMAKNNWINTMEIFIDSKFNGHYAKKCAPIVNEELMIMWSEVKNKKVEANSYIWRCLNFVVWAELYEIEF